MMCPNDNKHSSLYLVATINQSESDVLARLRGKKSNIWINTKDFPPKKIDKSKLEVIALNFTMELLIFRTAPNEMSNS